jgi:enoyl-CoA hydratase
MNSLSYSLQGPVALIGLKAPPVNALSIPLLDNLLALFKRASDDDDVRAVVLHSEVPRYFSAGLDLAILQDLSGPSTRQLLDRLYTGLLDAQFALGKPSIAAVAGAARGGGMTIAVSCNLIVAGEDASFGYPEVSTSPTCRRSSGAIARTSCCFLAAPSTPKRRTGWASWPASPRDRSWMRLWPSPKA